MKQVIVWILGGIAAFRLWEDVTWLAVLVILLAISYGVHPGENRQHNSTGEYSNRTATRLFLTFIAVLGIFIFSLLSN